MLFQHNLVKGILSSVIEDRKCGMAHLVPHFLSEFCRGSRELEGGLAALVVVMFYDAYSTHSVRVHLRKMVGYRELWSFRDRRRWQIAAGQTFCRVLPVFTFLPLSTAEDPQDKSTGVRQGVCPSITEKGRRSANLSSTRGCQVAALLLVWSTCWP